MTLSEVLKSCKVRIIIQDSKIFYLHDNRNARNLIYTIGENLTDKECESIRTNILTNTIVGKEISNLKGTLYTPMDYDTFLLTFTSPIAKYITETSIDEYLSSFTNGNEFKIPDGYTVDNVKKDLADIEDLRLTQTIKIKNKIYYILSHILLLVNIIIVGKSYFSHSISWLNKLQLIWILIIVATIVKLLNDRDLIEEALLARATNYAKTEFYILDLIAGNINPIMLAESIANVEIVDASSNQNIESITTEDDAQPNLKDDTQSAIKDSTQPSTKDDTQSS